MLRLLSIEFDKLKASVLFKIFILSYFIILSCIALIALVELDFLGIRIEFAKQGIFDTPLLWHINTWVASILKWFLAIIIVSSTVSEFQYGTLKQNLIDGLSKREFVLSKLSAIWLFSLVSCVFVFVVSIIMSYKGTIDTPLFDGIEYLGAYFLRLLLILSFAFFVAVLIKRSAFTLFLMFIWYVMENLTKIEGFGLTKISDFLPVTASSNLIISPITRLKFIQETSKMMNQGKDLGYDYAVHWQDATIVGIYILLFSLASYWLIKKRDL